jgi:hypothetical protein
MRGARARKANWGGGRGRDAVGRPDGAAEELRRRLQGDGVHGIDI